jgi:hypothetical protein
MKIKKILNVFTAAFLAVMILTSCGSGDVSVMNDDSDGQKISQNDKPKNDDKNDSDNEDKETEKPAARSGDYTPFPDTAVLVTEIGVFDKLTGECYQNLDNKEKSGYSEETLAVVSTNIGSSKTKFANGLLFFVKNGTQNEYQAVDMNGNLVDIDYSGFLITDEIINPLEIGESGAPGIVNNRFIYQEGNLLGVKTTNNEIILEPIYSNIAPNLSYTKFSARRGKEGIHIIYDETGTELLKTDYKSDADFLHGDWLDDYNYVESKSYFGYDQKISNNYYATERNVNDNAAILIEVFNKNDKRLSSFEIHWTNYLKDNISNNGYIIYNNGAHSNDYFMLNANTNEIYNLAYDFYKYDIFSSDYIAYEMDNTVYDYNNNVIMQNTDLKEAIGWNSFVFVDETTGYYGLIQNDKIAVVADFDNYRYAGKDTTKTVELQYGQTWKRYLIETMVELQLPE